MVLKREMENVEWEIEKWHGKIKIWNEKLWMLSVIIEISSHLSLTHTGMNEPTCLVSNTFKNYFLLVLKGSKYLINKQFFFLYAVNFCKNFTSMQILNPAPSKVIEIVSLKIIYKIVALKASWTWPCKRFPFQRNNLKIETIVDFSGDNFRRNVYLITGRNYSEIKVKKLGRIIEKIGYTDILHKTRFLFLSYLQEPHRNRTEICRKTFLTIWDFQKGVLFLDTLRARVSASIVLPRHVIHCLEEN